MATSPIPALVAVASWGAALLQCGVGAVLVTGQDAAARALGILLVLLAAATFTWGAAVLMRGRLVAPRLGTALSVAAPAIITVALFADPVRTSVHAAAVAVLLSIAAGATTAVIARRQARETTRTTSPARPTISMAALVAAAVVVAALVTPALGATEAGRLAPSHADHELTVPGHSH